MCGWAGLSVFLFVTSTSFQTPQTILLSRQKFSLPSVVILCFCRHPFERFEIGVPDFSQSKLSEAYPYPSGVWIINPTSSIYTNYSVQLISEKSDFVLLVVPRIRNYAGLHLADLPSC